MTAIDAFSAEYLSLSLLIDRRWEGFVDAYFGPPELKEAALAGPLPDPADLLARAVALRAEVERADVVAQRRVYLRAQTRAMEAVCRTIAGDPLPYTDEVRQFFDIEPAHTPEATYDAAIADLERLLPGTGDVPARMQAWRERYIVAPDVARTLIDRILDETRRRTAAFVDLPAGEGVEIRMVSDQPWSGYNWYLGGNRSRVEINTDLPIRAGDLVGLIAHEAYPGHHTEHMVKEGRLYRERGYGEAAAQLISAPQCVIAEGIATLAEGIVFPDGSGPAWAAAELYPLAGIVGDPEREAGIARAQRALRSVSANAALLMHDARAGEDEVVAYLMRYSLRTEKEARHSLSFIANPLWRAYIFCYHAGRDLLGAWLDQAADRAERERRFARLLTEQIAPSTVADWVATRSA
jgi:hypothetical protein